LGIESSQKDEIPEKLPFVLFSSKENEYTNQYSVDTQWLNTAIQALKRIPENSGFKIKKGPFITVSTITASDGRARALFNNFDSIVEQMEGSAAAHVSALYNIPFLEIRGISNFVGYRDKKSWNVPLACQNCSNALLTFIQNIDHTTLK
jgi:futalosine hydrolase